LFVFFPHAIEPVCNGVYFFIVIAASDVALDASDVALERKR